MLITDHRRPHPHLTREIRRIILLDNEEQDLLDEMRRNEEAEGE